MDKQDLLIILEALRSFRGDRAWQYANPGADVAGLQARLLDQLAALPDADAERLARLHREWATK